MIIYCIMIDKEKSSPVLRELNVRQSDNGLQVSSLSDCESIHSNVINLHKNISIDRTFKIIFNSNLKDATKIFSTWNVIYNELKNKYISNFLNSEESLLLNHKGYINLRRKMTEELKNKSFERLIKVIDY